MREHGDVGAAELPELVKLVVRDARVHEQGEKMIVDLVLARGGDLRRRSTHCRHDEEVDEVLEELVGEVVAKALQGGPVRAERVEALSESETHTRTAECIDQTNQIRSVPQSLTSGCLLRSDHANILSLKNEASRVRRLHRRSGKWRQLPVDQSQQPLAYISRTERQTPRKALNESARANKTELSQWF